MESASEWCGVMRIADGSEWGWIVADTSSMVVLGSMTSRVLTCDESVTTYNSREPSNHI